MNYLAESPVWEAGIRRLELDDPALGGPDGVSNAPLKQLANRTLYLRELALGPVGQVHFCFRGLSTAELIENRLLKPEYQIIETALYQELCDTMWTGAADNGARNVNGLYMRVMDPRGLFPRIAGRNAVKTAAAAPYDGKLPGDYIGDAVRNITGGLVGYGLNYLAVALQGSGCFVGDPPTTENEAVGSPGHNRSHGVVFDASRVVPTAGENRPASFSLGMYIKY